MNPQKELLWSPMGSEQRQPWSQSQLRSKSPDVLARRIFRLLTEGIALDWFQLAARESKPELPCCCRTAGGQYSGG